MVARLCSVIELELFRDLFLFVLYFPAFPTCNAPILSNLAASNSELDDHIFRIGRA